MNLRYRSRRHKHIWGWLLQPSFWDPILLQHCMVQVFNYYHRPVLLLNLTELCSTRGSFTDNLNCNLPTSVSLCGMPQMKVHDPMRKSELSSFLKTGYLPLSFQLIIKSKQKSHCISHSSSQALTDSGPAFLNFISKKIIFYRKQMQVPDFHITFSLKNGIYT